jgi:hypothetical protein
MDVFYYLLRGYDFDFIHGAMPSLTRDQFDAVVRYAREHHAELVARDRQVEEFHQRGMDAQHARGGIFAEADEDMSTEQRVARLREKMRQKMERSRHDEGDGLPSLAVAWQIPPGGIAQPARE